VSLKFEFSSNSVRYTRIIELWLFSIQLFSKRPDQKLKKKEKKNKINQAYHTMQHKIKTLKFQIAI
jgi:hypothetical protein